MAYLRRSSLTVLALAASLFGAPPAPALSPQEAAQKAAFEERLRDREAQKAERAEALALADQILDDQEAQSHRQLDPAYRAVIRNRLANLPLAALQEARLTGILPGAGTKAIGASGSDLIYTPVLPCRILDTRLIPNPFSPGEIQQFYAADSLLPSGYAIQGGNPAGCNIPFGPATAVVINFVAVGATAKGNLKAWPWSSGPLVIPAASMLNYGPGLNIANAVVVPICDPQVTGCPLDFFAQANIAGIDLVADVVGYFHRFPTEEARSFVESVESADTTAIGTSCTHYSGAEVTLDAPAAGRILARANAWLLLDHLTGTDDRLLVYIGTSPTDCNCLLGFATAHSIPAAWPSSSLIDVTLPVSCAFDVTPGSHTFYLNGFSTSGSESTDYFWFAGMDATFHPN